ncbi:MAG TPA: glycosyltransferase family 2 protein [Blastocatellia bacterium]|nr:glycosyltransferase family 2 protein [Blastocatellia bacterium]
MEKQTGGSGEAAYPLVSIVIPTYKRPDALAETLQNLLKLDYPTDRFEVIVVDDGSGDETPQVAARMQPAFSTLTCHSQSNAGAARARNEGAKIAGGEVLIFLDDDMIVPPSLIRQHLEALDHFGDCMVCGYREFAPRLAAILNQSPFGRFRLEVEPRQEGWDLEKKVTDSLVENCVEHKDGGITANNLAVRREDFLRLGGFDEEFPFAGYEDQELAHRARMAGFRCLINYGLKAWNNDRRLTLRQFCERQRRGAITAALIALKYRDLWMQRPLLRENCPIQSDDSLRLIAKKLAKTVLASPAGLAVLYGVVAMLERVRPGSPLLPRIYLMMCGLYIFRGIREGLEQYGKAGVKPHTAALLNNASGS